jgi:lipid-binding SYLF domain-containing protein
MTNSEKGAHEMKAIFNSLAYQTLLAILALVFFPLAVQAASKEEIDINVEEALATFYSESPAGKRLADRAAGMLVFPQVIKAGFGIGGEYGEGRCWSMVRLRTITIPRQHPSGCNLAPR